MANVYSLSLEGIHNAEVALERAARNIARAGTEQQPAAAAMDSVQISSAGMKAAYPSANAPVDFATELVNVKQAEVALKANFKTFASEQKLEREFLDLFA